MMSQFYQGRRGKEGQSFVELAIVLPLLLFMLIGFVEVGALVYHYLSMLDAAREAARFASERDPSAASVKNPGELPMSACDDEEDGVPLLHFYYDTACVVINPDFNPGLQLDSAIDDVTISLFWIENNNFNVGGGDGDERWPNAGGEDGVWSLYSENWTKNCDGSLNSTTPFITNSDVNDLLNDLSSSGDPPPPDKGMVLVEVYYCHEQLLGLPLVNQMIPQTLRLHAYSIMPAPQAQPAP